MYIYHTLILIKYETKKLKTLHKNNLQKYCSASAVTAPVVASTGNKSTTPAKFNEIPEFLSSRHSLRLGVSPYL